MIAFEELSAALDRWRARNGLPVVDADLPIVPDAERAAAVPAQFVMPVSAPATQPRTAPPSAAPGRRTDDSDVLAIGDADVVEDDAIYESDGDDFAMSFGGAPAPAPAAAPLPPAEVYEDEADIAYGGDEEPAGYVPGDAGGYQDPAYDTPQPLIAAEPEPLEDAPVEEEEDWSRMPNYPGHSSGPEPLDDDGVDERTIAGDDLDPKR